MATAFKQPPKTKGKKVGAPGVGSSSVDTGVMKRPAAVAADNFMEEALRKATWRADAEAARADAACAKAAKLEKEMTKLEKELTVANFRLGELRRSEMRKADAEVTKSRVGMRELTKGHKETLKQRDTLLEKNRVLLQKKDACLLEKKEANLQELLMQLKSKDEQLAELNAKYTQAAVERKEAVTILKMIDHHQRMDGINGQVPPMSPLSPMSSPIPALPL